MTNNNLFTGLSQAGGAIGRGLIAGFAGTAAITISQMIEMQLTGRGSSDAPMKVAGKVLGVEARGKAALETEKQKAHPDDKDQLKEEMEANKEKFSNVMHMSYGTGWGLCRGVLDLAGVRGIPATLIHFAAIWGTEIFMLPAAGASKPITKWSPDQIGTDVLHHAVYAIAAGAVYDALPKGSYSSSEE